MVESKSRKAAFLREAARVVDLPATVEAERFEVVAAASGYRQAFDVVSIRAVRMSPDAIAAASHFMAPDGCLALFVSPGASLDLPTQLGLSARTRLLDTAELLTVSADVPRGT
jgi:16S rRNA G527 N7-methylase RsmG